MIIYSSSNIYVLLRMASSGKLWSFCLSEYYIYGVLSVVTYIYLHCSRCRNLIFCFPVWHQHVDNDILSGYGPSKEDSDSNSNSNVLPSLHIHMERLHFEELLPLPLHYRLEIWWWVVISTRVFLFRESTRIQIRQNLRMPWWEFPTCSFPGRPRRRA